MLSFENHFEREVQYVVSAIIWCCSSALAEKENIDYRKVFSDWESGKQLLNSRQKGTVFDILKPTRGIVLALDGVAPSVR